MSGKVTTLAEDIESLGRTANRINENKEFYFRVFDDGDAMVMVIDANGNYSQHLSTDATEGDGDGAFGPYHWNDSQAWTKTTREHAETMLQFTFTDLER